MTSALPIDISSAKLSPKAVRKGGFFVFSHNPPYSLWYNYLTVIDCVNGVLKTGGKSQSVFRASCLTTRRSTKPERQPQLVTVKKFGLFLCTGSSVDRADSC